MRSIIILTILFISSNCFAFGPRWEANPWTGAAGTGVAPSTYDMTLAIPTSDSTLTVDGTPYTTSGSPHTIPGLSGLVNMVVTYGGTDDTTVFSGTDLGDVLGVDPNFSIDMDADKGLICTFSVSTVECTGIVGNNGTFSAFKAIVAGDIVLRKVAIIGCSTPANYNLFANLRYINLSDRRAIYVVYSDNAGEPSALQYETAPFFDAATSALTWVSQSIASGVLPAGDYWIGSQFESASSRMYYSTGTADVRTFTGTFGTIPATWNTGTDIASTENLLFYLDFD